MTVEGIDYVYMQTHDWRKGAQFWLGLGFELVLDLGNAGKLAPPGGGAGVWLEEVPVETPLSQGVYLTVADPDFRPPVGMVGEPVDSHWGTRLITVRDPDGREFILQHTPPRG